jgi:probable blue pigment (indigoidine) exporter
MCEGARARGQGAGQVRSRARPVGGTVMDVRALVAGFAFVAMWSSAFTSARIIVVDAPPFLALAVRFAISGALALAIGGALGQRLALGRGQWRPIVVFGICQNALYLGLIFVAVRTVEASVAVVVASTLPLLVAALDRVAFGTRLSPLAVGGLTAGLVGVLVITAARLGAGLDPLGLAYCVGAVLALAVATLTVRGASAGGNLWIVVGLQMLVGSAALLPVSLLLETWEVTWTAAMIGAFWYTVLVPGLAATMIWFWLVGRIGATRAASFHFLNPFLGVAIAAVVLGELVTLRDLVGVAIIMAGILAVQLSRPLPGPART